MSVAMVMAWEHVSRRKAQPLGTSATTIALRLILNLTHICVYIINGGNKEMINDAILSLINDYGDGLGRCFKEEGSATWNICNYNRVETYP